MLFGAIEFSHGLERLCKASGCRADSTFPVSLSATIVGRGCKGLTCADVPFKRMSRLDG